MIQKQRYFSHYGLHKNRLELHAVDLTRQHQSRVGVSVTLSAHDKTVVTTDPFKSRVDLNAFLHATVSATLSAVIDFLCKPIALGFLDARSFVTGSSRSFVSVLLRINGRLLLGSAKIMANDAIDLANAAARATLKLINHRLAGWLTAEPYSQDLMWKKRAKACWRRGYDQKALQEELNA